MFTNEFFSDKSKTVIMDETSEYEDVEVYVADDFVYFRQYNQHTGLFEVIAMSHKMYYDLLESRNHGEGLFTTKLNPR